MVVQKGLLPENKITGKNEQICARGLNCEIFVNFEVILGFFDENYSRKKVWCLCDTFEIFVKFEVLAIFEISNGHFGEMAENIGIFFVIFNQNNVLLILVEFESDRMGPRESAKNGRIGAYGLKCRIFLDSELIFEI